MKRLTIFVSIVALLVAATYWTATPVSQAEAKGQTSATNVTSESRAYLHSHNIPSSGLALEGYCPVAYFAVDKPVMGKPEYASTYNDVIYHFVSADAKQAFDADPEKYTPAYGG